MWTPPGWRQTTPFPGGQLAMGQTLVVRFSRQVHAVRAGETLSSIARDYGISIRQLWRNNWPLGGKETVWPGQVLVISYFEEKLVPPFSTATPTLIFLQRCWRNSSPI